MNMYQLNIIKKYEYKDIKHERKKERPEAILQSTILKQDDNHLTTESNMMKISAVLKIATYFYYLPVLSRPLTTLLHTTFSSGAFFFPANLHHHSPPTLRDSM